MMMLKVTQRRKGASGGEESRSLEVYPNLCNKGFLSAVLLVRWGGITILPELLDVI